MKKVEGARNEYQLTSGRTFYANRGIIGLREDCGVEGEFFGGFDDCVLIDGRNAEFYPGDQQETRWTPEERAELADEMIRRWTAFKEIR